LDTAEYGADDDGKDEAKVSLHAAAEEGNIDTVKSWSKGEWILTPAMQVTSNQTPLYRAAAKGNVDVVRSWRSTVCGYRSPAQHMVYSGRQSRDMILRPMDTCA
jgi:hypothetical protein